MFTPFIFHLFLTMQIEFSWSLNSAVLCRRAPSFLVLSASPDSSATTDVPLVCLRCSRSFSEWSELTVKVVIWGWLELDRTLSLAGRVSAGHTVALSAGPCPFTATRLPTGIPLCLSPLYISVQQIPTCLEGRLSLWK